MKLQNALEPAICAQLRSGLNALKSADAKKVMVTSPDLLSGSIDLDECLRLAYPKDSRWDYIIGIQVNKRDDSAIYLEVHPADSHGVDEVLKKLAWLADWIRTQPGLERVKPARYVWVATSAIKIPKNSPQWKRLVKSALGGVVKVCEIN